MPLLIFLCILKALYSTLLPLLRKGKIYIVHSGFDKQLSKWIARLSFTSLRAGLLLLLFLIPLPTRSLILCFTFEIYLFTRVPFRNLNSQVKLGEAIESVHGVPHAAGWR